MVINKTLMIHTYRVFCAFWFKWKTPTEVSLLEYITSETKWGKYIYPLKAGTYTLSSGS